MKHTIIASIFILLMTACGFFRAPGKDDCDKLISREKMTEILTEIYILEAFIKEYQQVERSARDSARYYYYDIFERHQIDIEVFEKALECYLLDRREMDHIHEKMLNLLSIKESEAARQYFENDSLDLDSLDLDTLDLDTLDLDSLDLDTLDLDTLDLDALDADTLTIIAPDANIQSKDMPDVGVSE